MADVFEDRDDLVIVRQKLWKLIESTDYLDWLLLTKRPENVGKLCSWKDSWPRNIWLGTTVENQRRAVERMDLLLETDAHIKFLSCEPLLGEVDLSPWIDRGLNWVIAGGESGPNARPSNPNWFRRLRDQCIEADVPFHFKQWGHWAPFDDPNWKKPSKVETIDGIPMINLGKKAAGRKLDGLIWDEFPTRDFEMAVTLQP